MARLKRGFTIAIVVLGGLLLLLGVVAHSPPARRWAAQYAVRALERANIVAQIGALDYNLVTRDFELRDVRLATRAHPGQPFFEAARVRVKIEGIPRVSPIRLASLSGQRMHISVVRFADGSLNWPSGKKGGGPPSRSWTMPDRLDLRNVQFTYRGEGFALEVPDTTWLAARGLRGLEGPLHSGFVTLRWPERALTLTDARGVVRWDGQDVSATAVRANVLAGAPGRERSPSTGATLRAASSTNDLASVEATAEIKDVFGHATLIADAQGMLDVATAIRWLPLPVDIAGPGRFTAHVAGPIGAPVTDATVTSTQLTAYEVPGIAMTSNVRFAGGVLEVKDTRGSVAFGTFGARGIVAITARDVLSHLEAQWNRVPFTTARVAASIPRIGRLDADLDGRLVVDWSAAPHSLDLRIENDARPAPSRTRVPVTGHASARFRGGRWTIVHEHRAGALTVTGNTSVSPRDGANGPLALGGAIHAHADDAGALMRDLRDLDLVSADVAGLVRGGTVTFDGQLSGAPTQLVVTGSVRGSPVQPALGPPLDVVSDVRVTKVRVQLIDAMLTHGANRLTASGSITYANGALDATADAQLSQFDAIWRAMNWPVGWEPRGSAQATLRVSGRLTHPHVEGEMRGELGVATLDPVPVSARLRVNNRELSMNDVRVEHPAGLFTGSGNIDLSRRERPFGFAVNADVGAAERLAPLFPPNTWPLSGTFRVRADARGVVSDVENTSVEAGIDAVNGSVWKTPIEVIAPATVRREGERVSVTNLRVRTGGSGVTINGELGPGAPGLVIDAAGLLQDFDHLVAPSRPEVDPLLGTFRATARVTGTLSRPRVEATLDAEDATVDVAHVPQLTGASIAAAIHDGTVTVHHFTGEWAGAPFEVTGSAPWRLLEPWMPERLRGAMPSAAGDAHVTARVTGLTPAALAPLVGPDTLANIGGKVSAHLSLDAPALRATAVRGTVVLDEADISVSQVPLRQLEPTQLSIADGRLRVQTLNWRGAATQFTAFGGLNWHDGALRWDLGVDANMNLRMASIFVRPAATAGRADISVSLSGPLREPLVEGRVLLQNAEFLMRDPRLAVTDVNGAVLLTGGTVRLEAIRGSVNGGTLSVDGEARVDGWRLGTMTVNLAINDAAVEFPEGLRSEIVADLKLVKAPDAETPLLSGTITALRGSYKEQFGLAERLFSTRRTTTTVVTSVRPRDKGLLGKLRVNIGLATLEDVSVETNYGRLEAGGAVRLGGTIDEPTLDGRVVLRPGGQVFLGGTTYTVERGSVEFQGRSPIEPQLDLTAQTRVGTYTIRLNVTGTPATLSADLTSDPSLDRSDIVSLLVTGRTTKEGGLSTQVVGEQVLGYLTGDILNFAGRAFGLDSVRIDRGLAAEDLRFDPTIIATETDPGSRLTIAKNFPYNVEIVLSQNLSGSGELSWMATWRPRRTIALRGLSLENTDRTIEFSQEISFGGGAGAKAQPSPERTAGPRVLNVRINGAGDNTNALRSKVELHPGTRFDFYKWQDDRERILGYYHGLGFYEAEVSAHRTDAKNEQGKPAVNLTYDVRPRARGQIVTEGVVLSPEVMQAITTEWSRSVFNAFLEEDVTRIVQEALAKEGYLRAQVRATVDASGERGARVKVLRIHAEPGPQTSDASVTWNGNTAIDAAQLNAAVDKAGLRQAIWVDPASIEPVVRDLYVSEGYVAAQVKSGTPEFDNGRARLPVQITEGPQARLGGITYQGVRAVDPSEITRALQIQPGDPVRLATLEAKRATIERFYRERGFTAVRVQTAATVHPDGVVDATVRVDEGPRQILANVDITGGEHTSRGLVTKALQLRPGEPLNPEELYQARRRLYETGAFRQIDLETEPVGQPDTTEASGIAQQPVTARIVLQEWPVWRVRYGLLYSDTLDPIADERSRGPGVSGDLERSNLFGRAVTAGTAVRLDRGRQAIRSYLSSPRFLGLPISSTGFVQETWEDFGALDTRRTDITFEQRYRRQRWLQVNYGYFYRSGQVNTVVDILGQPLPFEYRMRYSGLFSAVSIDRRDNPFDAQRGWFHSASFRYAPKVLGSDLRFIKTVFQQSLFVPLGHSIVIGLNGRLGLADGIGQEVIPDERFFAGGGASVRGYPQDSLSPRDRLGIATGGEALVVLNGELRFPVWRWLHGVTFLDAGNAYLQPSEIDLGQLAVGAGFGLRLVTPIGVLRLDYGIPTANNGPYTRGRLHFAFGQIF